MLSVLRREEKYILKPAEASYFSDQFCNLLSTDRFSQNGSLSGCSLSDIFPGPLPFCR